MRICKVGEEMELCGEGEKDKEKGAEEGVQSNGECEIERGYGLDFDPDFKYGL